MTRNEILIGLSESGSTKGGEQDFALQSLPQKVFLSVWAVESEVNNGGFSQYFLNSSAETAAFVVDALEATGAPKTANICRRAIDCAFDGRLPPAAEDISSLAAEFRTAPSNSWTSSTGSSSLTHKTSRSCCTPTFLATRRNLAPCPA